MITPVQRLSCSCSPSVGPTVSSCVKNDPPGYFGRKIHIQAGGSLIPCPVLACFIHTRQSLLVLRSDLGIWAGRPLTSPFISSWSMPQSQAGRFADTGRFSEDRDHPGAPATISPAALSAQTQHGEDSAYLPLSALHIINLLEYLPVKLCPAPWARWCCCSC